MRSIVSIAIVAVFAGYGVYLGSVNLEPKVALHLGFASLDLRLWQAVLGALGLGAGAIVLTFAWPVVRMRLQLRRQTRRIRELEQEIHGLRTLPLAEDEADEMAVAQEG